MLDGSLGEGGGQILRTSLALSTLARRPFRIERIRAGRSQPGLRRQHLAAVAAAAEISGALLEGAAPGSQELRFSPGTPRAGRYRFDVGSAGSTTLVLQTVLPVLMVASLVSELVLEGGTHNPWAPPFEFLERSFLPQIRRLGPVVDTRLDRHGFSPAGGGRLSVHIEPARATRRSARLARLELLERGAVRSVRASVLIAHLAGGIAEREAERLAAGLSLARGDVAVREVQSHGPGNVVSIEIESDALCEVITAYGRRGVRAEAVADEAVEQAGRYLASPAPVGEHLADQLLLPMAMAGGGAFRATTLSAHTRTNLEVLRRFLDVEARVEQEASDCVRVELETQGWRLGAG